MGGAGPCGVVGTVLALRSDMGRDPRCTGVAGGAYLSMYSGESLAPHVTPRRLVVDAGVAADADVDCRSGVLATPPRLAAAAAMPLRRGVASCRRVRCGGGPRERAGGGRTLRALAPWDDNGERRTAGDGLGVLPLFFFGVVLRPLPSGALYRNMRLAISKQSLCLSATAFWMACVFSSVPLVAERFSGITRPFSSTESLQWLFDASGRWMRISLAGSLHPARPSAVRSLAAHCSPTRAPPPTIPCVPCTMQHPAARVAARHHSPPFSNPAPRRGQRCGQGAHRPNVTNWLVMGNAFPSPPLFFITVMVPYEAAAAIPVEGVSPPC